MIEFPCPCGRHRFSFPDDMAGGLIQCPACHRLNDVPGLGELGALEDDGGYKLGPAVEPRQSEKERLDAVRRAFTRSHFDSDGSEIDLRPAVEDVIPHAPVEGPFDHPKYDPETGELIRTLEVKPPVRSGGLPPIANRAPPVLVVDEDHPGAGDFFLIPLRLCRPVNLLVMGIILLAHLFLQGMVALMGLGFWMIIIFYLIAQCLFYSHYGNVIDETGPTGRNELPTPLRNLSWHEDTWGPFWRLWGGLVLCYAPALLMWVQFKMPLSFRLPMSLALAGFGTLIAPAMMLTTITSGSWLNARPDRLFAVMRICGAEYLAALGLWIAIVPCYLAATTTLNNATLLTSMSMSLLGAPPNMAVQVLPFVPPVRGPSPYDWRIWVVGYFVLIVAIFLMHWFCWHLGVLYRRYHPRFPWIYQRYVRDPSRRTGPAPPRAFAVQPSVAAPGPTPAPTPAPPPRPRPPR